MLVLVYIKGFIFYISRYLSKILILPEEDEVKQWVVQGTEGYQLDESFSKGGTKENPIMTLEAQAVLDEIAFENLMATLL